MRGSNPGRRFQIPKPKPLGHKGPERPSRLRLAGSWHLHTYIHIYEWSTYNVSNNTAWFIQLLKTLFGVSIAKSNFNSLNFSTKNLVRNPNYKDMLRLTRNVSHNSAPIALTKDWFDCDSRRRRLFGRRIPLINLRRSSNRPWFVMAIPIPIRRCHLVNRSLACLPGQDSVDWSVAIGSVAPTDITSGADLTKEPFTTQVTYSRSELLFERTTVLSCDPCPPGRYVYVYANSPNPLIIQLCVVKIKGERKFLQDGILCVLAVQHVISPQAFSLQYHTAIRLLMLTNDCPSKSCGIFLCYQHIELNHVNLCAKAKKESIRWWFVDPFIFYIIVAIVVKYCH